MWHVINMSQNICPVRNFWKSCFLVVGRMYLPKEKTFSIFYFSIYSHSKTQELHNNKKEKLILGNIDFYPKFLIFSAYFWYVTHMTKMLILSIFGPTQNKKYQAKTVTGHTWAELTLSWRNYGLTLNNGKKYCICHV